MFFPHTVFLSKFYLFFSCHMHAEFYITHPFHPLSLHHSNHLGMQHKLRSYSLYSVLQTLYCFHPPKSPKHSTQYSFSNQSVHSLNSAWDKFHTHSKQQVNIHRKIHKIHHKIFQPHSPEIRIHNTKYNCKLAIHKTKGNELVINIQCISVC